MSEKKETEIERGASSLQREAESGKIPHTKSELEIEIQSLKVEEENLFHTRGYGGYILTEQLEAIRTKKRRCEEKLSELRTKAEK